MAVRGILLRFHVLAKSVERFQVELQGRYSVDRLSEFVHYKRSTSLLRAIFALVLTAIPCALGIVLVDVLPLQPPWVGLAGQSAPYWVRIFYSCCVVTGTSLVQWHHASPSLSLNLCRIITATLIIATGTALIMLALHALVGFPTPFLYQVISAPWQVMLAAAFWALSRSTVRANPEVIIDLLRFLYLWAAEVAMIVVYPVLNYVFRRVDGQYQTIFSMVLPLWKIALKNWCRVGTDRLEDLSPVLVVFNVDVFHALFLASAMQSSSATGSSTLVVVMTVDFIQNCVAIMEVYLVYSRIKKLESAIWAHEDKQLRQSTEGLSVVPTYRQHCSTIDYANDIFVSNPEIREHLAMSSSRLRRWTRAIRPVQVRPTKAPRRGLVKSKVCSTSAIETSRPKVAHGPSRPEANACRVENINEMKLTYVQANLKLLHMVEFYMLIEFTEVLIAVVYSTYLLAMAQLPNRQFYIPLQHLTKEQFETTVRYVIKYAALEMLSFATLAVVFDRMMRVSTLRQLAFTLEKHWILVQSLLVLWVFFRTQMTLEHLGCDYTFKFAWLRKHPQPQ